jgi:two-component system nitrogen regulation response regulator NtrX
MKNSKILIVDDEDDIALLMKDILSDDNYEILIANKKEDALKILSESPIDLVLLDIWLENQNDGIELLKIIKNKNSLIQVIMISGHGNIQIATETLKLGAYDYIEKPFNSKKLKILVKNALEHQKLKKILENKDPLSEEFIQIIGSSKITQNIRNVAFEASKNESRVFLHGEIGVGKKLISHYIHKNSAHANENFTIINSSNTSIINNIPQFLENYYGTILLDEITNFPIYFQKSLLGFINSNFNSKNKFRIISSSSKKLDDLMGENLFDQELLSRLSIKNIYIPSLRERIADIEELCNHFIDYFVKFSHVTSKTLTEDAINKLQTYEWNGNIEQLKKTIEWLLIYYNYEEKKEINAQMLNPELLNKINKNFFNIEKILSMNLKDAREEFEKYYLSMQIKKNNYSVTKTAEKIDMDRSALHRKLKSLNLECELL